MIPVQFFGNKLLFCKKKSDFDSLTLDQMKDIDTAFTVTFEIYNALMDPKEFFARADFKYKNKDLSSADLCINAIFAYFKFFVKEDIEKDEYSTRFLNFQLTCTTISNTGYAKESIPGSGISLSDIDFKEITTLGNSVLCESVNQHWITDEGKFSNVPYDSTVNHHTYKIESIQDDLAVVSAQYYERGVGHTKACGSGSYAMGQHLLKKLNKSKVIIKTRDGNEYHVTPKTISVKYV